MAALLVGLFVMGVMATVAMPVWTQAAQREKEAELVFRGEQYARAIGLFQRKMGPGALPPNLDLLVDQKFLRRKFTDPITGKAFRPVSMAEAGTGGVGGPGGAAEAGGRNGAGLPASAGLGGIPSGPAGAGQGGIASGLGSTPAGQGASGLQGSGPGVQPGIGQGAGGPGQPLGGIAGVVSTSKAASRRLYNGRDHYDQWAFVYNPRTAAAGGAAGGVQGGSAGGVGPGGARQPGSAPQQPVGPQGSGTSSPFGPSGRR